MTETSQDTRVPAWHVIKPGDIVPDKRPPENGTMIPINSSSSEKKSKKLKRKNAGENRTEKPTLPQQPQGYIKSSRYEFF